MCRPFISFLVVATMALLTAFAMAGEKKKKAVVSLTNQDPSGHELRVETDMSCKTGSRTAITAKATIEVPAGWVCVGKASYQVEAGKRYRITKSEIYPFK